MSVFESNPREMTLILDLREMTRILDSREMTWILDSSSKLEQSFHISRRPVPGKDPVWGGFESEPGLNRLGERSGRIISERAGQRNRDIRVMNLHTVPRLHHDHRVVSVRVLPCPTVT